eukprot:CAMPEP_0181078996 /NCGR_PEP_ID=MMETSP1071-20121207/1789_1 /TAXON_ID=35127 /ORGANISM="Thalassiosira sp., Strain NH16" /LENGTH=120 /DNA_ID=CAMNT_0023160359 /DNA_START=44 /DNA_END=403 /DNA_ORIENTATION=+
MQQRRPHSTVANDNGNREIRRLERKLAKERRGVKKVRRVKRSMKYGKSSKLSQSPWQWKSHPHFQIAFFSFGLFSLVGTAVFRMFHYGNDGGGGILIREMVTIRNTNLGRRRASTTATMR